METVPTAGPFAWNEGCVLMGEAEARPDGPHCVPRLDPQSDQGSLQPPLEMHARQECSRVSQATMALARTRQRSQVAGLEEKHCLSVA